MTKTKKTIAIILSTILLVISLIFILYYSYFYPKVPVTTIDSEIYSKNIDILKKFSLDNFSLSLKNKSIQSTVVLTDDDLTDLIIISLKKNSNLDEYITGAKVYIENDYINLYVNLKYKNIPLSSKFTFNLNSEKGHAILHYVKGKLGFISIPKEFIFSRLKNNSIIKFDENNGNILLSLNNINKYLSISNAFVSENKIYLTISGSLKFD